MEVQRGSVIRPRSHSKLVRTRTHISHSLPTFLHKPPCDCPGLLPASTKEEIRIESDLRAVSNLWICWVDFGMVTGLVGYSLTSVLLSLSGLMCTESFSFTGSALLGV